MVMVLDRVFSQNVDAVLPLIHEAAPRYAELFIDQFTSGIDQTFNPDTLLMALRNSEDDYVGWVHLNISTEWAELDLYHRLIVTVNFNQIYVGQEYRGNGYCAELSALAGALAARVVDLDGLYNESPASKPGPCDEVADPYRELTTGFNSTIIHPKGLDALQEFKHKFNKTLSSRCAPLSKFLWHPDDCGLDSIDVDLMNPAFNGVTTEDWDFMVEQFH